MVTTFVVTVLGFPATGAGRAGARDATVLERLAEARGDFFISKHRLDRKFLFLPEQLRLCKRAQTQWGGVPILHRMPDWDPDCDSRRASLLQVTDSRGGADWHGRCSPGRRRKKKGVGLLRGRKGCSSRESTCSSQRPATEPATNRPAPLPHPTGSLKARAPLLLRCLQVVLRSLLSYSFPQTLPI